MKLFKLKPVDNLEHLLDIVLNERLFCCRYDKLNDPFEGQFLSRLTYRFFGRPRTLTTQHSVEEIYGDLPHQHICSLSSAANDVRMWAHYASGHQGVAVEIDFSGIETDIHPVTYNRGLPEFGATLLSSPHSYHQVLTIKTDHWKYESEFRIIHNQDFYEIPGRIVGLHLGGRTPDSLEKILRSAIGNRIPISRATLNNEASQVVLSPL